ncbi:MAG: hypothetical protein WKH68_12170 [Candidatus Limnocylindria bacterium]
MPRESLTRIAQEAEESQAWANAQRCKRRPLWLSSLGFIAACTVMVVGIAFAVLGLIILMSAALAP